MAIPVFRQNASYDDWEVASVYNSDDCDSLGRSGSYESSYRSGSRDDPAFQLQGPLYDEPRPRVDYPLHHPQSQQQHRNYPPIVIARSRWDTSRVPGKRGNFVLPPAPIVPPPGMIFPAKDWVLPPEDIYSHPPPAVDHIATSDMPASEPPPPPLLFSPPLPPHAPSPLVVRPSPVKAVAHGQVAHVTSTTVPSAGTGLNANTAPIPPPPRYRDLAHTISPRLAEVGCQGHPSMAMNPRRPGHDVLSSCGPEGPMPRVPQASEEASGAEERYGGGVQLHAGWPSHGPGDRPELRPPSGPGQYEYEQERAGYETERMATARPTRRERRPSIWQRFVRRFSPSRGMSAGHT